MDTDPASRTSDERNEVADASTENSLDTYFDSVLSANRAITPEQRRIMHLYLQGDIEYEEAQALIFHS